MKCGECKRELEVGDRYIKFTASEWAERNGEEVLNGFDDVFAAVFGSGFGDNIVLCDDCTVKSDTGWRQDTVWGDEEVTIPSEWVTGGES